MNESQLSWYTTPTCCLFATGQLCGSTVVICSMWSDRVLGDICDPGMLSVQWTTIWCWFKLRASGSAVGNSAEWSPALRRVPTGVSLNIGSSLLCKTGQSIGRGFPHKTVGQQNHPLMLLQQIPHLSHRRDSSLLDSSAACSLSPIWLPYWIIPLTPPQSLPFFFSPSALSLFSLWFSNIFLLFFFLSQ